MITARIEVAPIATIKINRNSFVVAITFGTLDSITFNRTMVASFQSLVLAEALKNSKQGILFSDYTMPLIGLCQA
jgi:hypothetical protein